MNLGDYPGWLVMEYRLARERVRYTSRLEVVRRAMDFPEWPLFHVAMFRTAHGKWRCAICGATGYAGGAWMLSHLHHHPTCECGKRTSHNGLAQHRRHHTTRSNP